MSQCQGDHGYTVSCISFSGLTGSMFNANIETYNSSSITFFQSYCLSLFTLIFGSEVDHTQWAQIHLDNIYLTLSTNVV